jgi:hypothetical protein
MATDTMEFGSRGFWMHHWAAEVWCAYLVRELENPEWQEFHWLQEIRLKVNELLEAKWMTGVMMNFFSRYLTSEVRHVIFVNLITRVTETSIAEGAGKSRVEIGCWSAPLPEYSVQARMIVKLFTDPTSIPIPFPVWPQLAELLR